jgi:predicted nucleotidyltransferase
MVSVNEISQQLANHASDLRHFNVTRLSVFGSVARGDPTARDLDFMVEFSQPPGLENFMGLKFFLEEVFQMPVDLHSQASCPERFFKRIQADLKHVA